MVSEPSVEYNKVYDELTVVTQTIDKKTLPQKQVPKPVVYDYIMGNPPFVGARLMSKSQKSDVLSVFGNLKSAGNLDYVSCWYKKAADFMKGTNVRAALVSTNSITQGEQVANLWKPLMESGLHIDFAWRTFIWDSEANQKAHVHCVIVGFSSGSSAHLFQHLICPFVTTKIRLIKQIICIQYCHQTHVIKMQSFRYHLCPD